MEAYRVSCFGYPKDSWMTQESSRIFWVASRWNIWWLHTSADVAFEKFEDTVVISLGTGMYKGMAVIGNEIEGWNIVVSVNEILELYRFSADTGDILGYSVVGVGRYPRMFWSEELGLGLLVYLRSDRLAGRLTEDWSDYKSEIPGKTFKDNPKLGQTFKGLWPGAEGLTLSKWIETYEELTMMGIRGGVEYL